MAEPTIYTARTKGELLAAARVLEARLVEVEVVCASLKVRFPRHEDAYDCGVDHAVTEVCAALRGEGVRG